MRFDDEKPIKVQMFNFSSSLFMSADDLIPLAKHHESVLIEGDFTSGSDSHRFSLKGFTAALNYCNSAMSGE